MSEMIATIPGASFVERVTVVDPLTIRKAKTAIKKAFEVQLRNGGFSMVEVLSSCNIGWGLSPVDSLKFIKDKMVPYYPLGNFKDKGVQS